jgi:hypothetical protein
MPNAFGDNAVDEAPVVNQFGDASVSAPIFQLPEIAPSVPVAQPRPSDASLLKGLMDAADTGYANRQKQLDTAIDLQGVGQDYADIAWAQAEVGQKFYSPKYGLIRKVSQDPGAPSERVRPGFLNDVGQLIKNLPEAIMVNPYAIQEPVANIVENPDVRAMGASIGSSLAGARAGAPLGPYGVAAGGVMGAALAEPYVQSQIPSTATEAALRVASGGFARPIAAFDQLALRTGPRIATAAEQSLIGAGMGGVQATGNALEQGRLPTMEEFGTGVVGGGTVGGVVGGAMGGQRAKPLLEPKTQNLANKSAEIAGTAKKGGNVTLQQDLNQIVEPQTPLAEPSPEVAATPRMKKQSDLDAAFGTVRADTPNPQAAAQSAQTFIDEAAQLSQQEARLQRLIDEVAGKDDKLRQQILALRQRTPAEQFQQSLELVADYRKNPQRYPEEMAKEIEGLVDKVKMDKITTTEVPAELGAPNQFGDFQARSPEEATAISMAGGTPEEVASLRRGLAPLEIPAKPLPEGSQVEYLGKRYEVAEGVGTPVDQWQIKLPGEGRGRTVTAKQLELEGFEVPAIAPKVVAEPVIPEAAVLSEPSVAALASPEPTVSTAVSEPKVVRSKDFATNGTYEVSDGTNTVKIYRDPEDKTWYFDQSGTGEAQKHFTELHAGLSKAEAVAAASDKLADMRLPEPQVKSLADPTRMASVENDIVPPDNLAGRRLGSRIRSQRGGVDTRLVAPLSGAGAGGVTGFVGTERQPGESEAAFQARRLQNTAVGAGAGLLAGSGGAALSRAVVNKAPATSNAELAKVRDMLKTAEGAPRGMFERVQDASFDFLTRANTAWAPLEKMQRNVYKLAERPFKAGSYYDLADRGESIAGAVVHAQREAGLLADLVNGMPKPLRPRFPEYLVLNRIKDRLERIPVERAALQDAVGRAEAELQAAKAQFAGSKTLGNAQAVNNRKAELSESIRALNEESDRLRVAGWSLDDPQLKNPNSGIAAMEQEVGPEAFAQLQTAGQDFQSIMLNNLRRQVDSGRMPQAVFNAIADSTDFYAPFKVMKHYEESTAPVYSGGGRSVVNIQPITKKITGIDDLDLKLANPLEPAFEQIYKGTLLAEKNRFLREVSTLAALDKDGVYIRLLKGEEGPRKGFKEVPFLRNGEVVRMEVADDVHEALTSPNSWAEKSIVLNSLKAGSTLFKMGATALQAPFQLKNALIYDPARLAIMSKYGIRNPADALRYVFMDYPIGMWSSVRTSLGHPDELGEKWLSSGAANSTFARVFNPESFAKNLPREESAAKVIWRNQFGLIPLNNASAIISSALEQSAKITGLKRALRFENMESMTPVQRERKWREVVHEIRNYAGSPDFNRMGTDMGIINVLMPFTNARWQGFVADAGRLAGNDKAGNAAKARLATMVGLPAAGLMMWNLRPENKADWEQLPERERARGFYIPLYQDKEGQETVLPSNMDGTKNAPKYFKDRRGRDLRQYYVLPKREFPQLMGNATEDFVRWLETEDPVGFANVGNTLLNIAAPVSFEGRNATERVQSALSGVNPVIRTPMEVALNRDMFRQKDIIPASRLGALQTRPELTYSTNTPDVYKDIAGAVPESFPSIMRSPAVAQKVIEDFTGGFPRQFINPKDKPDQTMGERLTRSFRRSENVDLSDAENAIEVAKGESTAIRSKATDVANAVVEFANQVNDPARVQKVIQQGVQSGQIDKMAYTEIVRQLKERQMGYTPEQSQVSRLSKQERAFFYHERVKSLRAEERAAYLQDAVAKWLIDREVAALMMQLK